MSRDSKFQYTGEWSGTAPKVETKGFYEKNVKPLFDEDEKQYEVAHPAVPYTSSIPCPDPTKYDVPDIMPAELTGYRDIDEFLHECLSTMRSKGHDYREGNDDDLLHNFRTVGEDVGVPMEKIWYTYASKHWKAIKTFIKEGGQSESEPIEGRIKDVIVYMLLLFRMTQEMKERSSR